MFNLMLDQGAACLEIFYEALSTVNKEMCLNTHPLSLIYLLSVFFNPTCFICVFCFIIKCINV